uniref:PHD finger protein ALFIN-LIKE n=1 Tax=Aegilops tauschii subsp. strangulata TaxID=200361 RepID=A0A453G6K5_AEGTS
MNEKDWLALVAVHSDSWLLSVAFYFGARFGFDKENRRRLFNMINNLPTIYEVVTGIAKKQSKEKTPNSSSKSSKPSMKVVSATAPFFSSREPSPVQRPRCQPPRTRRRAARTRATRRRRSTTTPCAGPAAPTTARTSSGSAATTARSGTTASASRSRPPGRSTSSTTGARSAPTAAPTATRGSRH